MGMGMGPGMGMGMGRLMRYSRDDLPRAKVTKELLLRIGRYYKPYWKQIALTLIAVAVGQALSLVPTMMTKNIIDVALPQRNLALLARFALLSFGATFVLGLMGVGESYLNTWVSKQIICDMRNSMYNHLQYMSMRFFSNTKIGEIMSRLNNDVSGIEGVFSGTIIRVVRNFCGLLFIAVTLVSMNWKLSILALFIVPMFVAPTRRVGRTRWRIAAETQAKLAELSSIIQETLNVNGAMLVKISTREKDEYRRFSEINREISRLQIRESIAGRWFRMVIQIFTHLGPVLIYFYGGYLFIQGELTVGAIVTFVAFLHRLYGPIGELTSVHIEISRSMALFERIFEYLDLKHEITDAPNAVEMPEIKGRIEFENIHFSYTDEQETLKDISFVIEQGQMTALVGLSGSGKTTITYLLARLYDPASGTIRIDGLDIRDVKIESLRSQIGIVTQDTYIFNASIRENLLYSKPDAGDDEIVQACKIANIHDFIMTLPQGYDTIVGERGTKLSGGEKQRISIARAVLKNPRIIILDEATSSLDSLSERLIQDAIKPLLAGRTSIVIAHRLSTIIAADQILVMDQGRIVQRGTHEELVMRPGLYRELYEKQFKAKAAGELG
ncbi:MAG TPA: ABC transporter ATP-binding protein [Limnochordia bacterium]|jgi:ATP-binding cassette subfamily B protein|nr:ABC transporter ATP-binding protein [Bacillota bacterium]HOB08176.1 ABC transporter ATP-binding protein [Limnochordia bacterium]HPT92319.1 ABC transporter ATP-binding protein [Limnochordia bacterium]HPZ30303.1 ABC transporter ATP-binding protein [Limnochordia bacterium]